MPLVLQPASNRATASGGQTVFNYTFTDRGTKISPILVFTLLVGATTRVEQTVLINYTLDRDAKTVTFLVGLAVGTIVDIDRGTNRTRDVIHDPASTITGAILNRDEEQSFRYTQELEELIARKLGLNDRRDQFLAADRRIITLADAVDQQDAMNRQSTVALITGSGNLPAPGGGVVGFVLTALNATDWGARDRGVPIPQTADVDKVLQANAAGEGAYEFGAKIPRPITGDSGKVLTVDDVDSFSLETPVDATVTVNTLRPQANLIINGDFMVAQKGLSFTATAATPPQPAINDDNTVLLDRWVLLSDGDDVVDINQATVLVPDGAFASLRAVVTSTGAGSKFAHLTVLENKDTIPLLADGSLSKVSASFKAATVTGAVISNIRWAIVTWEGTADVITRDIVDGTSWGAAGTDPTLASLWSYQTTPANLALVADVFTEFKLENVTLSIPTAGIQNIGILIWIDDTNTVINDELIIADVKLEPGAVSTKFVHKRFVEELLLCRHYWQQSYDHGVFPGTLNRLGARHANTVGVGFTDVAIQVEFSPPMRIDPTVLIFNPFSNQVVNNMNAIASGNDPARVKEAGHTGVLIEYDPAATVLDSDRARAHFTADAEL